MSTLFDSPVLVEKLDNNWQSRSPGKWFINSHAQSPEVSVEGYQNSMQGGERAQR